MSLKEYLHELGFEKNPFLHTNAEKEQKYIANYFVEPEYFEDLWGDPDDPIPAILYAPRGGGKTAWRLMFEKRAMEMEYKDLLVINYTDHDLSNFKSVKDITLSYHLEYLNRLLLLSFLDKIYKLQNDDTIKGLDLSERSFIYKMCKIYLYNTPLSFPKHAISSLKTLEDKIVDFWKNFKEPVGEIVKSISRIFGAEVDLSKINVNKNLKLSHRDNFINIKVLLNKVGIKSIYILIDKVDEQELTGNDIEASHRFISPILKDLTLLDTEGVGFKFFLWDELRPYTSKICRSDRIESYTYHWDFINLQLLLNKRLKAYSNSKIKEASQLFESGWDVHSSIGLGRSILFAEKSPRDLLRICKRAVSEQYRINNGLKYISMSVLNLSIDKFCKEKSLELLKGNTKHVKTLTKLNSVSFLLEEIQMRVQILDEKSLKKFVSKLQSYGLLTIVNNLVAKGNIPINEYAFSDIRIARSACSSMNLQEFINKKVRDCKTDYCKAFSYRNFEENLYSCLHCNRILNEGKSELGISDRIKRVYKDRVEFAEDGFEERTRTGDWESPIFNDRIQNNDRIDEK